MVTKEEISYTSQYYPPFSTQEAAAWLGMSVRRLLTLVKDGTIPGKKIGGKWYFSQEKLAHWAGIYD